MNTAQGIAQHLSKTGVAILHYSESGQSDTFLDDLPQVTQDAGVTVGIFHVGGVESDSRDPDDTTALQVVIRGTTDPRDGINMWHAIYSQLHGLEHTTLPNGDHLIACIVQQSGPINLGRDENDRYKYSMNLRCEVSDVTTHRS